MPTGYYLYAMILWAVGLQAAGASGLLPAPSGTDRRIARNGKQQGVCRLGRAVRSTSMNTNYQSKTN